MRTKSALSFPGHLSWASSLRVQLSGLGTRLVKIDGYYIRWWPILVRPEAEDKALSITGRGYSF